MYIRFYIIRKHQIFIRIIKNKVLRKRRRSKLSILLLLAYKKIVTAIVAMIFYLIDS